MYLVTSWKLFKLFLYIFTLSLFFNIFTACVTQDHCGQYNLYRKGFSDALDGYALQEGIQLVYPIEQSCYRKYNIKFNYEEYKRGYKRGLEKFCCFDGGYNFGISDRIYKTTCPSNRVAEFLKGYSKGLLQYRRKKRIDGAIEYKRRQEQEEEERERQRRYKRPSVYDIRRFESPRRRESPGRFESPSYESPRRHKSLRKYELPKKRYESPGYESPRRYESPKKRYESPGYESPRRYESPKKKFESPRRFDSPKSFSKPSFSKPVFSKPSFSKPVFSKPSFEKPRKFKK